jgi:hypothetical protein
VGKELTVGIGLGDSNMLRIEVLAVCRAADDVSLDDVSKIASLYPALLEVVPFLLLLVSTMGQRS